MTEEELKHVKDFTIFNEYGMVCFEGETDLRQLDLDSIVEVSPKVVIVYGDDSKKPDVGKGLNKPALVHLYNAFIINEKLKVREQSSKKKYEKWCKKQGVIIFNIIFIG